MTAETIIEKYQKEFREKGIVFDLTKPMIEFAKQEVKKIQELQACKYYAGETGYITKTEWKELINNIK